MKQTEIEAALEAVNNTILVMNRHWADKLALLIGTPISQEVIDDFKADADTLIIPIKELTNK